MEGVLSQTLAKANLDEMINTSLFYKEYQKKKEEFLKNA